MLHDGDRSTKKGIIRTVHGIGYRFESPVKIEHVEDTNEDQTPSVFDASLYVFISYSHQDSLIADDISRDLAELGIEYFLDRKDIGWGESIRATVRKALRRCTHQVIILSPASIKSHWVHFEAGWAMGANRVALPFVTHPSLEIPGYFGDLLFKTSREEIRKFFQGLEKKSA
jgi:hypothetical protein